MLLARAYNRVTSNLLDQAVCERLADYSRLLCEQNFGQATFLGYRAPASQNAICGNDASCQEYIAPASAGGYRTILRVRADPQYNDVSTTVNEGAGLTYHITVNGPAVCASWSDLFPNVIAAPPPPSPTVPPSPRTPPPPPPSPSPPDMSRRISTSCPATSGCCTGSVPLPMHTQMSYGSRECTKLEY